MKPGTSQHQSDNSRVQFTSDSRGQTSIDLLFAVSIFFVGIALLVVVNPMLFFPGDIAATDRSTSAESVTTQLESNELKSVGVPGLDHDKVVDFFGSGDSLEGEFAKSSDVNVHVKLSYIGDGDAPPAFGGGDTLERGDTPGRLDSMATKNTTLDGKPVKLTVTVWIID